MIRAIAARAAHASLRTLERVLRVKRYSTTLYDEIANGAVTAAVAERIVTTVLWHIRLRKPMPEDWSRDRVTRHIIREVQTASRRERRTP